MDKVLIVDLTSRSVDIELLQETVLADYLGGRGLGAYLLYRNLSPGVDPLSPENVLVFSVGPAQGTTAFYSSRAVLSTKSPLTGIYLYSVASGNFGHRLRKAGYMALVVKGRSPEPVYLRINDDKVEFRSARRFWGLKTIEAQEAMLEDADMHKGSCVCIGPAGERLLRIAAVVTEGEKARTFGRGGAGAVMGSKNLKGIVLFGSKMVDVANQQEFNEAKKAILENVKKSPQWVDERRRFGTGVDIPVLNELGILPTRNWQSGVFEGVRNIALTEIEDIWPRSNVSCGPYCVNPCAHIAQIDRGPWKGARTEGPEYETIYALGSNCGVDQFDAIVAAGQICDEYGIDTMSCGVAVAFAMECYEKGLITKEETGGLELRFGDAEAMVKVVELIAKGEGFGALLSQGVRKVSEKIPGSSPWAMHCKGLEFGGYECRGMWGQALQFALNSRGGCHHGYGLPARTSADQEAGTELVGKGEVVKEAAIDRILYDCAIMCTFPRRVVGVKNMVKVINSITGKDFTAEGLKTVGFRVLTLERMFNVREGLRRKDDYLPKRLTEEPLPDGPHKGSVVPMDALLDEGYQALGWDKTTGIPLRETLEALGLAELCL